MTSSWSCLVISLHRRLLRRGPSKWSLNVGSPQNKGTRQKKKKKKRGDRPQADDGRQTGQANALCSLNHVTVKQLTVSSTVKINLKEEKKKTKKRREENKQDKIKPIGNSPSGINQD